MTRTTRTSAASKATGRSAPSPNVWQWAFTESGMQPSYVHQKLTRGCTSISSGPAKCGHNRWTRWTGTLTRRENEIHHPRQPPFGSQSLLTRWGRSLTCVSRWVCCVCHLGTITGGWATGCWKRILAGWWPGTCSTWFGATFMPQVLKGTSL